MTTTSTRRPERKPRSDGERSRRTILDAAAKLATVEGLDGLSIGRLADHIGVIHRGRLVAQDSMAALRSGAGGKTLEEIFLGLVGADEAGKPALDWLA